MLATELDLPTFDHTDPELRGERYREAMAELSSHADWLARSPLGFIVLDHDSAEFFVRTQHAVFPGLTIAQLFEIESGPLHEEVTNNIINLTGERHGRLRQLVNPALGPRAIDRCRPAMREFLGRLLDAVPADGTCEFIEAIAKPYPSLVIAELMGAPLEDAPALYRWSNWIQRQFDPLSLTTEREEIERAVNEFYAYEDALIAARRQTLGQDLISDLIRTEQEGDRLSHDELRNLILNILVGGVDTSQSQLAHAVRLLAEHPDQWELLRSNPRALAPAAVEEALRFEPVTPFTARITVDELEWRGVTFPPGTIVLVSAWHANRDGLSAESFDISSERARSRPLTFGAGVHYCAGANLARAELEEALAFLAERIAAIELDGEPRYGTPSGIYGLEALPLRLVRE